MKNSKIIHLVLASALATQMITPAYSSPATTVRAEENLDQEELKEIKTLTEQQTKKIKKLKSKVADLEKKMKEKKKSSLLSKLATAGKIAGITVGSLVVWEMAAQTFGGENSRFSTYSPSGLAGMIAEGFYSAVSKASGERGRVYNMVNRGIVIGNDLKTSLKEYIFGKRREYSVYYSSKGGSGEGEMKNRWLTSREVDELRRQEGVSVSEERSSHYTDYSRMETSDVETYPLITDPLYPSAGGDGRRTTDFSSQYGNDPRYSQFSHEQNR